MRPGKTFCGKALIVTGALLLLLSQSAPSQAAPTLDFATYLGGGDSIHFVGGPDLGSPDWGHAVALDADGNVYVAGETWSQDLFFSPGVGEDPGGFLGKFSPTGDLLDVRRIDELYITDMALDDACNVYLTGYTWSDDLPLVNEYQGYIGSSSRNNAYLMKLTPDLDTILYSTYLGGINGDEAYGIAVDDAGHAYLTGRTICFVRQDPDFPTTEDAFMSTSPDTWSSKTDAWVAKFDTTLTGEDSLVYSTYLGGTARDFGSDIAIDSSGNAYIAGLTNSMDFPLHNELTTRRNYCPGYFISKLDDTGSSLLYSTYLGSALVSMRGDEPDWHADWHPKLAITADDAENVYITGEGLGDLPVRNAYDDSNVLSISSCFVTRLDTTLVGDASVIYSTYLGGEFRNGGMGIATDGEGRVFVTGHTDSPDFPCRDLPVPAVSGNFDIFLAKFDTNLTGDASLIWSTYLGGTGEDVSTAMALGIGIAVAGFTLSEDFPVTSGASQPTHANSDYYDAFVMKWSEPADIAIPFPDFPSIMYYPPLAFSVLRPGPSECQPLGAVQISRSTLHAQVALPMFQVPANLYLALYGSDEPIPADGSNNQNLPPINEMYFLNGQGELEQGMTMTPWMVGVTEPVSQLLAVDVQALQIDEPYLNLAVIARAPLSQVDQVIAGMNQFNGYYAWITQIPVPRNQLGETLLSLETLLATNQVTKDKALQQAIAYLQNSLNPEYWLDPWTLDDELGREALKDQEKAVQKLRQTKSQHQDITQAMADILEVDYTLATYAIVDAIILGGNPRQTKKARENLIKAGKEQEDEDFRSAMHYYELAWTQAEKAW